MIFKIRDELMWKCDECDKCGNSFASIMERRTRKGSIRVTVGATDGCENKRNG